MKEKVALTRINSGPKVYPIFRIVQEDCWLVSHMGARIGEEYVGGWDRDLRQLVVVGPVVPGTLTPGPVSARHPMGDTRPWKFLEYRVRYGGDLVATVLPVTRKPPKRKERTSAS